MTELLQELIVFLKNASPVLWETLLKQVYVEVVADLIWAIALLALTVGLVKLGFYGMKESKEERYSDWELGMWLSWIGAAVAGLVAFGLFVSAIMWVINPEFYAIRFILQQLN